MTVTKLRNTACVTFDEDGYAMPEKVFCYHCRCDHTSEQVRLIQTKSGKRWRCYKSLSARRSSTEARDAFGASVSQLNKSMAAQPDLETMPHCVLDILRSPPASSAISGLGT